MSERKWQLSLQLPQLHAADVWIWFVNAILCYFSFDQLAPDSEPAYNEHYNQIKPQVTHGLLISLSLDIK